MEQQKNRDSFQYTYSAREQAELRAIRQKYLPPEENKIDRLRRLDARVTNRATIASLVLGILGALVLGVGMCCVLVWQNVWFVPGIIIGMVGLIVLSLAYPVYMKVTKKEREKIAPEIMRLTDELLK